MNWLSALYGAVIRVRNELYDRRILTTNVLKGPVVSVGSLTVGGSGKTPFVILMGHLLKQRGIAFDVLSRGYRRETRGVAIVDPSGSARDFGDEPLLIASKLGVPVVVGEDRYRAGETAEASFGPQLHLLDDGFQHRRLARDFEIVLVATTDTRDSVLPAGRLREPLSSLSRADAVVLTNEASPAGLPLEGQIVWRVRRGILAPERLEPYLAFCGIARPENFFTQLREAGVVLAATRSFPDHHRYTDVDIRNLRRLCQHAGAAGFLTTEKDVMNLGAHLQTLQPLQAVPVGMHLENAEFAVDTMLAAIAERKQRAT